MLPSAIAVMASSRLSDATSSISSVSCTAQTTITLATSTIIRSESYPTPTLTIHSTRTKWSKNFDERLHHPKIAAFPWGIQDPTPDKRFPGPTWVQTLQTASWLVQLHYHSSPSWPTDWQKNRPLNISLTIGHTHGQTNWLVKFLCCWFSIVTIVLQCTSDHV